MFAKGSKVSGKMVELINDYREFLGIKGKIKTERCLIKIIMTHCDIDDKPHNP